jgi:hypothetical protein
MKNIILSGNSQINLKCEISIAVIIPSILYNCYGSANIQEDTLLFPYIRILLFENMVQAIQDKSHMIGITSTIVQDNYLWVNISERACNPMD